MADQLMTQQLSPAAQAVLDAFLGDAENSGLQMDDLRENVAAALHAAADQVVPMALCVYNDDFAYVRHQMHAIADELDVQSQ